MKFLKNIVITFGLLCGFIQANAMDSKINKVFFGTWTNETDEVILILSYSIRNFTKVTIPARTTIKANSDTFPNREFLRRGTYLFQVGQRDLLTLEITNEHFGADLRPLKRRNLDDNAQMANLNFSDSSKMVNVYINGAIKKDPRESKLTLTTIPVEVLSLKEQSMKATIQKLKKEGKSLEEAKQIIHSDLHELLQENWN